MNKRVVKNEFYYPSKDGATQIHAIEWIPDGKVEFPKQKDIKE